MSQVVIVVIVIEEMFSELRQIEEMSSLSSSSCVYSGVFVCS